MKMLLDRGADVNSRNSRGYSPLMLAAGSDAMNADIVKLLLAKGADTTFSADYDETAQVLAGRRGDTQVTRLLGGLVKSGVNGESTVVSHKVAAAVRTPAKAIEIALPLLEKQSHNFIRIGGCNSCHAQDLVSSAAGMRANRGIPAPLEIAQLPQSMMPSRANHGFERGRCDQRGLGAVRFRHEQAAEDAYTDAASGISKRCRRRGNCSTNESRRPPMARVISGCRLVITR